MPGATTLEARRSLDADSQVNAKMIPTPCRTTWMNGVMLAGRREKRHALLKLLLTSRSSRAATPDRPRRGLSRWDAARPTATSSLGLPAASPRRRRQLRFALRWRSPPEDPDERAVHLRDAHTFRADRLAPLRKTCMVLLRRRPGENVVLRRRARRLGAAADLVEDDAPGNGGEEEQGSEARTLREPGSASAMRSDEINPPAGPRVRAACLHATKGEESAISNT